MEDNFEWTDALVGEYGEFYRKAQETYDFWGQDIIAAFKKSKSRPPEGIIPMWLHNEHRLQDLNNAIKRYKAARMKIPDEWIGEKQSLDAYRKGMEDEEVHGKETDGSCLGSRCEDAPVQKGGVLIGSRCEVATDDVRERITGFRRTDTHEELNDVASRNFGVAYFLSNPNTFEISAALSKDNVEFRIGDEIEVLGEIETIKSFSISHNVILANYPGYCFGANIDLITKAEEKKVLFTTEDGFSAHEGDKFFAIDLRMSNEIIDKWHIHKHDAVRKIKFFGTKTAAEKYLAYNQKSISWQELRDYLHLVQFDFKYSEQLLIDNVLKHFKPKESATK